MTVDPALCIVYNSSRRKSKLVRRCCTRAVLWSKSQGLLRGAEYWISVSCCHQFVVNRPNTSRLDVDVPQDSDCICCSNTRNHKYMLPRMEEVERSRSKKSSMIPEISRLRQNESKSIQNPKLSNKETNILPSGPKIKDKSDLPKRPYSYPLQFPLFLTLRTPEGFFRHQTTPARNSSG